MPAGFTLIELMIVISVVIVMSAVAIPSFRSVMSGQRLQAVAWQMVQDMKTAREDAILYQQDLNVYINYNNTPVVSTDPTNKNNRCYLFETFQWGMSQSSQAADVEHYVPGDSSGHFIQRVLQYGIIITSVAPASSVTSVTKNYQVLCFRSGAGSTFRGEADAVTAMSTGTKDTVTKRVDSTSSVIGNGNLVITLQDPATLRTFTVTVKGTGEVSMGGS
jgi:prepilin-type N-terminal cleavage/methylation domain-containing protein